MSAVGETARSLHPQLVGPLVPPQGPERVHEDGVVDRRGGQLVERLEFLDGRRPLPLPVVGQPHELAEPGVLGHGLPVGAQETQGLGLVSAVEGFGRPDEHIGELRRVGGHLRPGAPPVALGGPPLLRLLGRGQAAGVLGHARRAPHQPQSRPLRAPGGPLHGVFGGRPHRPVALLGLRPVPAPGLVRLPPPGALPAGRSERPEPLRVDLGPGHSALARRPPIPGGPRLVPALAADGTLGPGPVGAPGGPAAPVRRAASRGAPPRSSRPRPAPLSTSTSWASA